MKKILVTGAAGFIGSHLVDKLLRDGHAVLGLDNLRNGVLSNLSQAMEYKTFTFINGDILKTADVKKAIHRVDIVYHLACLGVRHSIHSPFENHQVNAEGTLILLKEALEEKVSKFYYISTSEIYGKAVNFPIVETDPTYPLTVYGASKLAGEHYTHSFNECYGLDTTVLRIFNNYGPRAHYEGDCGEVIPRTIVRAIYGENPVIFGDGSITRDFYFVKDTADLLAMLPNHKNLTGETINIGTGDEITMKSLLEKVASLMPDYQVQVDYLEPRPADVPRLWVDNSKMHRLIDVAQGKSFEEGLKETIDFYIALSKDKDLSKEVDLINWEEK